MALFPVMIADRKLPVLLLMWSKIVIGAVVLLGLSAGTAAAEDVPIHFSVHGGMVHSPISCDGTGRWEGTHLSATCHGNEITAEFSGNLSGAVLSVEATVSGLGTEASNQPAGENCLAQGSLYPASGRVTVELNLLCLPSASGHLVLSTPSTDLNPAKIIASPAPGTTATPTSATSAAPQIDPIDEVYVAVQPAKVRQKPDVTSTRVKTLGAGDKINVMGKLKGQDWYLVSENDQPLGYVIANELVPQSQYHPAVALAAPASTSTVGSSAAPQPAPAASLPPMDVIDATYVAVNPAKVRVKPDAFSNRIKTIDAGQKITVAGKLKGQDWYLVSENDKPLGYVAADQLVPESQYHPAVASATVAPTPSVAPAQPAIPPAFANLDFGRYQALVIGNDAYANGIPQLRTAANDARAVAGALQNEYGFKVKLLVNATRAQIIGALAKYRETLTWDDNLLIYYAGHGSYDQSEDQGYWLPVDAASQDPTNWVSNTDLTNMLKAMQARHVMIVADSCYSGTLTRDANVGVRNADYIQRMVQKKARTVMTSGGLEPVSDTGGSGHSVFAMAFIAALQQNTGVMDAESFFTKVREPVVLAAPQTPEYSTLRFAGHEGGDFIFVRK